MWLGGCRWSKGVARRYWQSEGVARCQRSEGVARKVLVVEGMARRV